MSLKIYNSPKLYVKLSGAPMSTVYRVKVAISSFLSLIPTPSHSYSKM